MKISLILPAAALLILAPVPAPGQDKPHELAREFFDVLPRKAPSPSHPPAFSHSIDWGDMTDRLGSIIVRGKDTPIEPIAMLMLGVSLFNSGEIDAAQATFEEISVQFASHPLVDRRDKGGTRLIDSLKIQCAREIAFRRTNEVRTLPQPELDPDSDTTLNFSKGPVVIRFYKNAAPLHRENFLKLAKEGYYDRTRIHRLVPATLVQLGDPNSREQDLSRWGQGGPGYTLDNEFSLITHRRGTVSMYRGPGRPRSHGSQFQILLKDQPNLDFVQTPFAEVVSGIDVIDAVSRQSPNQFQAPVDDVFLNGIAPAAKFR